jgi:hypothetical protein
LSCRTGEYQSCERYQCNGCFPHYHPPYADSSIVIVTKNVAKSRHPSLHYGLSAANAAEHFACQPMTRKDDALQVEALYIRRVSIGRQAGPDLTRPGLPASNSA